MWAMHYIGKRVRINRTYFDGVVDIQEGELGVLDGVTRGRGSHGIWALVAFNEDDPGDLVQLPFTHVQPL